MELADILWCTSCLGILFCINIPGSFLSRFNFLDKSTGLSTPFEIKSGSVVDAVSKIVETQSPLHVAGVEGLVIPAKSRGQVLRMLDDNCALVRWEVNGPPYIVNLDHIIYESIFYFDTADAGFRFPDNYLVSTISFLIPPLMFSCFSLHMCVSLSIFLPFLA